MNDFFDFEADFVASLRCIPMNVRFKLDLCGVKLSLKAWSRFDFETRERLASLTIRGPGELAEYQGVLLSALAAIDEPFKGITFEQDPVWLRGDELPQVIEDQASAKAIALNGPQRWSGLNVLQRFALLKLTRPGHDNDNLAPALREFGLAA